MVSTFGLDGTDRHACSCGYEISVHSSQHGSFYFYAKHAQRKVSTTYDGLIEYLNMYCNVSKALPPLNTDLHKSGTRYFIDVPIEELNYTTVQILFSIVMDENVAQLLGSIILNTGNSAVFDLHSLLSNRQPLVDVLKASGIVSE